MASIALQPGEQVVATCRRHWIYLWPTIALIVLILLVPPAILFAVVRPDGLGTAEGLIVTVLSLAWVVFWAFRAYFTWYRYRNDMWIITTQRLIDSNRRHWFHHELSSADLVDVTDTSVSRSGVIRTMLNFGNLECQTAGQQQNFVLSGIPRPVDVLTALDRARDEARREVRGA